MSVTIRPKRKPVNRMFLVSGFSAIVAWSLWPAPDTYWQADACFWMFAAVTVFGFGRSFQELIDDYNLRAAFAASEEVTDDHGSAREASWAEVKAAGMADPNSGAFLGLYQGRAPVFAPPKTPFSLVEMPPGAGKTVNCVMGSILHRARLGASIVVADPKLELGVMLGPKLREQGFEVWFANPTQGFAELCGDIEINPYQSLLDTVHATDERRLDAPKFAADYAELHYPTDKAERNPYFSHGSRRTILSGSLIQALVDPSHCKPTDVYRLLADPRRFIKALEMARDSLQSPRKDDQLVDFLRGEAANLLDRAEKNEENFGAFLEGATQRLLPFNQAGRVAGYGRTAVHNIAELRERQVILFIMTPLSHMRNLSAFTSCLNHNIIAACKDNPSGHPVHIVGEEALNYQFTNLCSDLETLRGLSVTADFYIQSFHGLIRRYGRDDAMAIEAYADVKMYAGVNSLDRAKFVSDMLAEETIRKQDYSYQAMMESMGVSSRELGRRLMMPNEVLTMPRHLAWTFVRGMNPMLLSMANYGEIAPWRDWVDANPLEGAPLRSNPRFTLHYPEKAYD
jgi:type IV secretion system protein VirD4